MKRVQDTRNMIRFEIYNSKRNYRRYDMRILDRKGYSNEINIVSECTNYPLVELLEEIKRELLSRKPERSDL